MRGNNVVGIIFSNMHDELLKDLTDKRTMGSVPFGGRYRLIDFPLSNMVNSGINRVGVITKANYQSLMDHLGSGKPWDLSRKRDGLFILPPFGNDSCSINLSNRIEMISSISGFLRSSREEYVLLSDCDVVGNIDFNEVVYKHINRGADITLLYKHGELPKNTSDTILLSLDNDLRINDIRFSPKIEGGCDFSLNIILMKKDLLLNLIDKCIEKNKKDFSRDILQKSVKEYKMFGYEIKGFSSMINSTDSYFETNMKLMKAKIRDELFNYDKPIYTKTRDDMPCKYGIESSVKNSVVANGCIIEGQVENSILFRGVYVGKEAKISNCIIMQDTKIGKSAFLDHVICDKDVVIHDGVTLIGYHSYPVYISKASII